MRFVRTSASNRPGVLLHREKHQLDGEHDQADSGRHPGSNDHVFDALHLRDPLPAVREWDPFRRGLVRAFEARGTLMHRKSSADRHQYHQPIHDSSLSNPQYPSPFGTVPGHTGPRTRPSPNAVAATACRTERQRFGHHWTRWSAFRVHAWTAHVSAGRPIVAFACSFGVRPFSPPPHQDRRCESSAAASHPRARFGRRVRQPC